MAVKGLNLFSAHFADFRDAFILIGGAIRSTSLISAIRKYYQLSEAD